MTVSVIYDTDLDKVKRIIKQIGKELQADPEFAPHILETLKMQGVEQFGDFAIQIRLKMMTKPGEQFVIRRRAYAMIKKAFDANGIEFAFPTVTVAGGGEARAAVAQNGLDLVRRRRRPPDREDRGRTSSDAAPVRRRDRCVGPRAGHSAPLSCRARRRRPFSRT